MVKKQILRLNFVHEGLETNAITHEVQIYKKTRKKKNGKFKFERKTDFLFSLHPNDSMNITVPAVSFTLGCIKILKSFF